MRKRITHKLANEREILFDYYADVGYLAVVDLDSYVFFVTNNLTYDEMLSHLAKQTAKRRCVAWGCPEKNLQVRLVFTRDHKALESITDYASGFQRWIRTRGRLCFTDHNTLQHCATNRDWSVFLGPESPDCFLPRELLVPPGTYSMVVFRHFGWFEGDQDAPLLRAGPHYTVILRHYDDESLLGKIEPPSSVPWT